MNAYEIPGERFTLIASYNIARHKFVSVSPSGKAYVPTDDTEAVVGVTYTEADTDQPISIVGSGIVMVIAGEAIAAGDVVTFGASGVAMKGTKDKPGKYVAMTSASKDDLVSIKL